MSRRAKALLKKLLSRSLPDSERLRYLAWLPRLERWRRLQAADRPVFTDRAELYRYVNADVLGNPALDFLEFGVSEGASLQAWTEVNTRPDSRFVGFDTFRGLPDAWPLFSETVERGRFDTGGRTPEIDDPRVSFVVGLFHETLPGFLQRRGRFERPLVVHLDADLYSSTLFVLASCHQRMPAGTLVLFDEFSSMLHEFRALEDYAAAFRRGYEVVALASSPESYVEQVAIRLD